MSPAPSRVRFSDLARSVAPLRYGLIAFGWINVGLGIAGAFLPVMPTTIFILIALWAFSNSSRRFHDWLYNHPRYGVTARNWHEHRTVPIRAKVLAVTVMAASAAFLFWASDGWVIATSVTAGMTLIAVWIVTRPARPPA